MDKMQEMNIRLTVAVKALESKAFTTDFDLETLKDLFDWIVAPAKQSIVPATAIITQ